MKSLSKSQVGLKKLPKKVRKKMGYLNKGGSVEVDGVMQEHYRQLEDAPMSGGTESGHSRGGGAALRGTIFRGVK